MITRISEAYAIQLPGEMFVTISHDVENNVMVDKSTNPSDAGLFPTLTDVKKALKNLRDMEPNIHKEARIVRVETRTTVRSLQETLELPARLKNATYA